MKSTGSSPLARGTRAGGRLDALGSRLIPARAGNTVSFRACWVVWPAHPRSRGEHCSGQLCQGVGYGSSPLARGTRGATDDPLNQVRLIPARAGNTWGTRRLGALSAAHPRSRGEHGQPSLHSSFQGGSSPLARGTLKMKKPSIAPTRLIPARAGNTPHSLQPARPRPAHPRSRGEHVSKAGAVAPGFGSSPLARGTRRTA